MGFCDGCLSIFILIIIHNYYNLNKLYNLIFYNMNKNKTLNINKKDGNNAIYTFNNILYNL